MMKKREIEVLAPAGSMECLRAAVLNGADAVYLGGEMFGARAYAGNFNQEELCEAIDYAHMFGKKIFLTINTLMKEKEKDQLIDFLIPYYEQGLDAAIIQDPGVIRMVREYFPDLEIHASTQMTVTGVYGARMVKKMGAKRVVPARELSLEEIKEIKDDTGLDMECFVHGALCYCYSGQCFMSSMLGGRSGNRGRCAGTCRLPFYKKGSGKKQKYLLSLKDLCTIEQLPETPLPPPPTCPPLPLSHPPPAMRQSPSERHPPPLRDPNAANGPESVAGGNVRGFRIMFSNDNFYEINILRQSFFQFRHGISRGARRTPSATASSCGRNDETWFN